MGCGSSADGATAPDDGGVLAATAAAAPEQPSDQSGVPRIESQPAQKPNSKANREMQVRPTVRAIVAVTASTRFPLL